MSADDYVAMLDTVGLDHGVLIQISVHGVDNGPIVEARDRLARLVVKDQDK